MNCDTRLLAKLYRDAPTYFTEFNNWKGRPVYFLYGVFGAPAMEAIALPLWAIVSPYATSDRKLSHYRTYFSLHLVYYLLNVVMVPRRNLVGVRYCRCRIRRLVAGYSVSGNCHQRPGRRNLVACAYHCLQSLCADSVRLVRPRRLAIPFCQPPDDPCLVPCRWSHGAGLSAFHHSAAGPVLRLGIIGRDRPISCRWLRSKLGACRPAGACGGDSPVRSAAARLERAGAQCVPDTGLSDRGKGAVRLADRCVAGRTPG